MSPLRGFSALILAAVVGGGSADLAGQPVGSEFRVNTYTTGAQSSPAVLTFPTTPSPFVVAWDGEGVGDRDGIFFRRFSAPAAPLGSDLRANTTVAIGASQVDLAAFGADLAGGFVIVWTAQGTGSSDVRARRFGGASSTPVGVDFRVNASSSGYHSDASVATAANGDFVVVWADTPSGDSPSTVQARRFSSSAAPLGAEFRLDSSTTGTGGSDVAADATGGFVVIWSQLDGDGHGIFMQRMSAAGSLVGTALRVNVATTGDQTRPVIAGGGGAFLVAWSDFRIGPENVEIGARRLDSLGNPVGSEFRLNTYTSFAQENAVVAGDSAGNFLVVWRSSGQDGSSLSVHGRLLVGGAIRGGEFRVNTYTTNVQQYPVVGTVAPGMFVVAWESIGQDGNAAGLFGRTVCVHGDATGDGVVDVSDVFYLINSLFAGGPAPVGCADVNGDIMVDVNDVFYLINFLFAGGPPPV